MERRFTWDPKKARLNLRDHRIAFEAAIEVFDDPFQVILDNYEFVDEQRLQIIGMTRGLVLLMVVYVDRSEADTEIIRIIPARKAEKYEEKIYARGSQD